VLHFAIALLVTGPALDLVGLLLKREVLLSAGRWNTLIGAGVLIFTALSGLAAEASLGPHSAAGAAMLSLHKALGLGLLAIWIPAAVWRGFSRHLIPVRLRTLYLTLSYVGAALVLAQAALGSALVYRHGVGLSAAARAEPMAKPK
jgi:uncharacterized membrane protein